MPDVHIIGEAGTNHNGSAAAAEQLVDVAVDAGVDSVKFQIIYPDGLYLPELLSNGRYVANEVFHKRAAAALTDDEYRRLAHYCRERAIAFSASVFDRRGLDLLDELDAPYIKIASCDLNNSRLLREGAERGRRLVISTGMASMQEIERAMIDVAATGNENIVLLHCVSVYPAETRHMNVGFIAELKRATGFPVGLSDHTEESLAGAMAIALGAEWLEKHFTLDRRSEGFDHAYAMEPTAFARYVADMRAATEASTTPDGKVRDAEEKVKLRARRGLYAARDLESGVKLREADVLAVRPESAFGPNDLSFFIGRTVKVPVRRYEPLSPESFA